MAPVRQILELETAIDLARRLGMADDVATLEERTAELGKVLNGLRRSLAAKYGSGSEVREDHAEYGISDCALRPEI